MAYGVGGNHVGPYDGREFDVVKEIGDGPGAILFMHELTRNILPVVRGLDQFGSEYSVKGFKAYTLMLTPDRTAGENRLKAANGSLKLRNPILLSLDGAEGPGNYALNRKATLSLVMVNKGKVVRTHAFTDVNAEDEGIVRGWVEETAGSIPADAREYRKLIAENLPVEGDALQARVVEQAMEIRRLQAQVKRLQEQAGGRYNMRPGRRGGQPQMRRDGGSRDGDSARPSPERGPGRQPAKSAEPMQEKAKRQGAPPTDPQLNGLLRSFIRKTNNNSQADEIFAEIEARAAASDALRAEAVEMFKLMLSFRDNYGSPHAQSLAEGFLKKHGKPEKPGRN